MEGRRPMRWVRAGVGGGLLGLLVSTTIFWSDTSAQLGWMAVVISAAIAFGLFMEWRTPWADGFDDSDPLDDSEPDEAPDDEFDDDSDEEEDDDEQDYVKRRR